MQIVPYPQKIHSTSDQLSLALNEPMCLSKNAASSVCISHALKRLQLKASVNTEAESSLWSASIGSYQGKRSKLAAKSEAYTLDIDKHGIAIQARDSDGLFWALTTIQQLLSNKRKINHVNISDFPALRLRYHHDDISRKQVSTVADFKRIIQQLSWFKIKYYTPYMEDMLFLKSNPEIGLNRGRLEPKELAAMHAEAAKYNVTIFPTYSLIGHQENLLQHKKYRKYAQEVFQEPSSYDPRKKILRPYLKKIIADVCELFPDSPYFHACFDEILGLPTEVIIDHANWCATELKKHDKKMMMWIDMFKNHDAIPDIKKLHPDIILVEWNYAKPGPEIKAYQKLDRPVTGLAGYSNWCAFLPDFSLGKNNMNTWAKTMKQLKSDGFGCSMWGDHGYENARDLTWNLYAYYGEITWRGNPGPANFEARFQTQFYGKENPALLKLIEIELPKREISPSQLWRLFRNPIAGLQRSLLNDASLNEKVKQQLLLCKNALKLCSQAKKSCLRQAEHIDHFEVGILREQLILKRLALAQSMNQGMNLPSLKMQISQLLTDIRSCRQRYQTAWLRHNKRQNIEMSLEVYDFLIADAQSTIKTQQAAIKPKKSETYESVSLDLACNSNMSAVYGVPIGQRMVDDIPFQFPPPDKTHVAITPNHSLDISLSGKNISDLHFIYGGQTSHDKVAQDCFRIQLYKGNTLVFEEQLQSIKDICCWWAPRGDHMWAGGGLKYVNPKRTSYAYDCRNFHGLLHLQHFKLPRQCQADRLCLSANGNETIALFALSIEH